MGLIDIRPGRSLYVETKSGSPDGALAAKKLVVLLLHGGCANLQQFRSQMPALTAAGVSTVSFDYLGCGRSDKPRNAAAYDPEELYQDCAAIFERYTQESEKVAVVGHSFGTAFAIRLAAEKKDRVAAVALISAVFPQRSVQRWSIIKLLFLLPEFVLGWLQPMLTEGFLKGAFCPKTFKQQPDLVAQERLYSNANPPYMFRAFHRQAWGFVTPVERYEAWTAAVFQPAAVIYGDADGINPLFPNSAALMRHLQHASLTVVADASHQVMQEQPKAVNCKLLELLESL